MANSFKTFLCISRSVSPLKGGKKEGSRHSSSSSPTPEEGRKRRPREARRGPRVRSEGVEKVEKEEESSVGKDEVAEDAKGVESSDEMSINL